MSVNGSSEPIKHLYRSKIDRMISGVCAGLADYLSIDVILIRILWVILTMFGGVGLLLYIASVIIIPENPDHLDFSDKEKPSKQNDKTLFWGALLIILGGILVLKQFGFFHYFYVWNIPWQMIWAIFFILVGVFLLYNRSTKSSPDEDNTDADLDAKPVDKHQVFRSRDNKMIAGVCAGLADYFNIDATIVRLAYALLSLASLGIGIVAYIVMVLIFPEKPLVMADEKIETNGKTKK